MIVAVIPARYASTRLPGKPLIDLEGQSMIERVWRAASLCKTVDKVIVATDDGRVAHEVKRLGGDVEITSPELQSGTDRCYAVISQRGLTPNVVVNIQGDEPLLTPELVDSLIQRLLSSTADVSTPVMRITDAAELEDPSVVKVVMAANNTALLFSRSVIPFNRNVERSEWLSHYEYWKHAGIYAYRIEALRKHIGLPVSKLEIAESLEQLRMLEQGAQFLCVESDVVLKSVDTPSDAERVREYIRKQN